MLQVVKNEEEGMLKIEVGTRVDISRGEACKRLCM